MLIIIYSIHVYTYLTELKMLSSCNLILIVKHADFCSFNKDKIRVYTLYITGFHSMTSVMILLLL